MIRRAYLDIETTGLSMWSSRITVVGLGVENEGDVETFQLVGEEITDQALFTVLDGVERLYTYNGRRFDLPFIKHNTGLDIESCVDHVDLMFLCWQNNLMGGLKKVERRLNIPRKLPDVNGLDAVRWWWEYVREGDQAALESLLAYNAEDVESLRKLRELLHVR